MATSVVAPKRNDVRPITHITNILNIYNRENLKYFVQSSATKCNLLRLYVDVSVSAGVTFSHSVHTFQDLKDVHDLHGDINTPCQIFVL